MSKLYVVATPIGNLKDITLRALEVLAEVDLVVCEDTRVTRKLLSYYDIKTPTESYHARSTSPKTTKIISVLRDKKNIALVSDSGTPTVSDPGSELVRIAKEELGDSLEIIPIPGSSALIAGLSASGLPTSEFLFLGFLPHKKGREKLFNEIMQSKRTVVFYESPHRILKTLDSLSKKLTGERKIVIARELTKIYEEIISGNIQAIKEYFYTNTEKNRGEFVVMIKGM